MWKDERENERMWRFKARYRVADIGTAQPKQSGEEALATGRTLAIAAE